VLAIEPLGPAVVHGDAHPGNAVLRPGRAAPGAAAGVGVRPVLLDWGRARLGSPLEDVSSWLQSLRYWEAEARRRHDRLLGRYLAARGLAGPPSRDVRDAYWLAAACNVLAGALRYHLTVATGWGNPTPTRRTGALRAARDCLRIIRRADACWSSKRTRTPVSPHQRISVKLPFPVRNASQRAALVPASAPTICVMRPLWVTIKTRSAGCAAAMRRTMPSARARNVR
jgi:hypothetical protein